MHANELAIGRNWRTADSCSMTAFGGNDPCFRVDLRWADGGWAYTLHNTKTEALDHIHSLGWA